NESWQQVSVRGEQPPARHAHTAVTHDNHIWVYGGMTDLVERSDFWKYDIASRTWTQIRARPNPGLLHSHVAVKLHSSMIIFGVKDKGDPK
ncbi:Kelch repeat-containing protein 2, partial [Armadillidium vulgare]